VEGIPKIAASGKTSDDSYCSIRCSWKRKILGRFSSKVNEIRECAAVRLVVVGAK